MKKHGLLMTACISGLACAPGEGSRMNVSNNHGSITIIAEEGREDVEVKDSYSGPDAESGKAKVHIQQAWMDDSFNVRVDLAPGETPDLAVDLEVRAPPEMRFAAQAMAGSISIKDAHAGGEAQCRDDIFVTGLKGKSNFHSTEGSIHLQVDLGEDLVQAKAEKGTIDVTLPKDTRGTFSALTMDGSLDIRDLDFSGARLDNSAVGTFNNGGKGKLRLHTDQGDITVAGE